MVDSRHAGLTLVAASLATLTACATTHGALTSSANLDLIAHDANVLAADTRADSAEYGSTDYSRDGRHLAERARELRRTVESGGGDEQEGTDAFDRLARSYETLRDDAETSGNPNAFGELRPVTRDYLALEWEAQSAFGQPRDAQSRAWRSGS